MTITNSSLSAPDQVPASIPAIAPTPTPIRYIVTAPGIEETDSSTSYHIAIGPKLARASAFFTAGQIGGKVITEYADSTRVVIADFSTGIFAEPPQSSPPAV